MGSTAPYKAGDPRAREAKRRSARKRRALASSEARNAERESNRERNRAARTAIAVSKRPPPGLTDDELNEWYLRAVSKLGPREDGPRAGSQILGGERVTTGTRSLVADDWAAKSTIEHVDISAAAIYDPDATGGPYPGQLGKGYDYNPANTFGRPWWWVDDRDAMFLHHFGLGPRVVDPRFGEPHWWQDTKPNYDQEERRWIRYCLGFCNRNASMDEGKSMEARGLEIATTLRSQIRDVQWVAGWLRDGWRRVPRRSTRYVTPQRVDAAIRRLQDLGLVRQFDGIFIVR